MISLRLITIVFCASAALQPQHSMMKMATAGRFIGAPHYALALARRVFLFTPVEPD